MIGGGSRLHRGGGGADLASRRTTRRRSILSQEVIDHDEITDLDRRSFSARGAAEPGAAAAIRVSGVALSTSCSPPSSAGNGRASGTRPDFARSCSSASRAQPRCCIDQSSAWSFCRSRSRLLSAAAIIGITTISGNSILFSSKNQIKGLTTSVGLWACGTWSAWRSARGCIRWRWCCLLALLLQYVVAFPRSKQHLKDRSNHFEVHLELKNKLRSAGLRLDHPRPRHPHRRYRVESRVLEFRPQRVHRLLHRKQRGAQAV